MCRERRFVTKASLQEGCSPLLISAVDLGKSFIAAKWPQMEIDNGQHGEHQDQHCAINQRTADHLAGEWVHGLSGGALPYLPPEFIAACSCFCGIGQDIGDAMLAGEKIQGITQFVAGEFVALGADHQKVSPTALQELN